MVEQSLSLIRLSQSVGGSMFVVGMCCEYDAVVSVPRVCRQCGVEICFCREYGVCVCKYGVEADGVCVISVVEGFVNVRR